MWGIKIPTEVHGQKTYLRQTQFASDFFQYLVDWKSNNLMDRIVNVHTFPLGINEIFQIGIIFIGNSYDVTMGTEYLTFALVVNNITHWWRAPWITTDTCYRLLWSEQDDKIPCASMPKDNFSSSLALSLYCW